MKTIHATYLFAILFIPALFMAFTPDKNPVVKQQAVFVCPSPESVVTIANNYKKYGYFIKEVIPQSVSVSVNSRSNSMNAYDGEYKALYGKFILILEK